MNELIPKLNCVLAWVWICLGFGSGVWLGSHFHKEHWLGGYTSFRRRLYRLGHISFFGLALVNLMFYFTARQFPAESNAVTVAAWGFVIGAVTMPLCCLVTAHFPNCRMLFGVPVLSLIVGGSLTLWEVIKL